MASQDIEIKIKAALDTLDAAKGVGDLRSSLRELKGLALETGDSNTDAFKRITAAIGETNDKIGDLNAVIKSQSGEPIENLSNSFAGLRGNLLSLDIKSFKQQFSVFTDTINNLTGNVFSGFKIQKNYNAALLETGSATKAAKIATMEFSAALAATGIGVLIIALGALIANFEKLKDIGGGLGTLFTGISGAIDDMTTSLKYFADALQLTNFRGQEQTKQRLLDLNKTEQALTRFYDTEIKLAEASGQNTEQLYKNRDMLLLNNIKKGQDALQKSYDENKGLNEEEAEESKRLAQLKYDIESNAKIRNAALRKKEADDKKRENDKEIADADRKSKEQQRINERTARENERISKETAIRKYQETLEDEKRFKSQSDLEIQFAKTTAQADADWAEIAASDKSLTYDQILQKLAERYKKEQDLAKDNAEKLKERDKFILDKKKENFDIEFTLLEGNLQGQLDYLDSHYQEMGMTDIEYYLKRADLEKELTNKTEEENKKRKQSNTDALNAAFDGASSLVSAISGLEQVNTDNKLKGLKKGSEEELKVQKESFKRQKALSLVMAAIDGAKAITAILSVPDFTLGVASAIRIAATVASTAVQIATIASKQFNPSATSETAPSANSGGGGSISIAPPSTIGLGQMNITPQRQQFNWQKVYVVESDIRNTTNKVEVIENRSVLGS